MMAAGSDLRWCVSVSDSDSVAGGEEALSAVKEQLRKAKADAERKDDHAKAAKSRAEAAQREVT
eukprot:2929526-Rhodomonas_salina.2